MQAAMNYQDVITVEPGKRAGQPCLRGLRITVYDVLSYLASGMTKEEILSDFPSPMKTSSHLSATRLIASTKRRCLTGEAAPRSQHLAQALRETRRRSPGPTDG